MTDTVVVTTNRYHKPIGASNIPQCGHAPSARRCSREAVGDVPACRRCFDPESIDSTSGECETASRFDRDDFVSTPLSAHSRASGLEPCGSCFAGDEPDVEAVLVLDSRQARVYHAPDLFDGGEQV